MLLIKVVTRAEPFHCTTELAVKFVPVTVSVNAGPPVVALEGESEVISLFSPSCGLVPSSAKIAQEVAAMPTRSAMHCNGVTKHC